MHSKELRQAVNLALDTMGMRGPVKRRDVAEKVLQNLPAHRWAIADQREAWLAHAQACVTTAMGETHSPEYVDDHFGHIPEEYRAVLKQIPRFICISPRGGRDSEHVMSLAATPEHWEASFKLKERIIEATHVTQDRDREIHDLLVAKGASSLLHLFSAKAAAE